jgi:hypothetical protein
MDYKYYFPPEFYSSVYIQSFDFGGGGGRTFSLLFAAHFYGWRRDGRRRHRADKLHVSRIPPAALRSVRERDVETYDVALCASAEAADATSRAFSRNAHGQRTREVCHTFYTLYKQASRDRSSSISRPVAAPYERPTAPLGVLLLLA